MSDEFIAPRGEWMKITQPKIEWTWHVFGRFKCEQPTWDGKMTYSPLTVEMPAVPLWHRILTRIFLRSVWEKKT